MASVTGAVPALAGAAHFDDQLSEWYVEDGIVHVGLTVVSPAAIAALQRTFDSSVVVFTQARPAVAVRVARATGRPLINLATSMKASAGHGGRGPVNESATPATQTYPNRLLDAAPYFGGDRIIYPFTYQGTSYISSCTANTEVAVHSTGATAALTAGHCAPSGTVFSQGYQDASGQGYATGTYGTVTTVSYGAKTDAEILAGGTLQPTSYLDTQYIIPSKTAINRGAAIASKGTAICTDGSFTNFVCGGTVTATNICINETEELPTRVVKVCGLDEATAASSIVQSGDSGGPVFAANSPAGTEILDGIISAQNNNGKTLFFAAIATVNSTLGTGHVNG